MSPLHRLTAILFAATCVACQPIENGGSGATDGESGRASLPGGLRSATPDFMDVPVTGIQLGWGYNIYDSTPLPNRCVVFSAAEEPAQTRTLSMKEVTDTYELQQRLNITAEASVKAMGVEGKGKASFAKDVNLSGSSIHFLLDATVDNGVRYAAPYSPDGAGATGGAAVRLTEAAARLARSPEEFLRQCGTGYVSAVYSGASLNAVVSITTSSRAEKEDIRAEVEAKGWGATASASTHAGSTTQASQSEKSVTVLMVGGRGDSLPKDQAEIEAKLKTLSYSAYEAPKDFRMAVTPYEALPNWPQQHQLNAAPTEMEQLAGLYGDYNTLYDEIEFILEQPELFAALRKNGDSIDATPITQGGDANAEQKYLESLQDYVHLSLRRLEAVARECLATEQYDIAEGTDCTFDESQFVSSYALRSQMPVEMPTTTPVPGPQVCAGNLTGQQLTNCRQTYRNHVRQLLVEQAPLDRYAADRWILSKSQSRCRLDVVDSGCLTNTEVRHWQGKVGSRLLLVPDADKRARLENLEIEFDASSGSAWTDDETYRQAITRLATPVTDTLKAE